MKKLSFLLFLGLVLRLLLSIQFYSGDINNHISWGVDILVNGPSGIYDKEFYFRYGTLTPNYPPLILLFFTIVAALYNLFFNLSWWLNENIGLFPSNIIFLFQNPNLLPAFFKLPAILADIGIAYFIYKFSRQFIKSEKWSLIASSLVLFNPAFFYNSSLWGQVEAVPTFFVLATFYSLLYSKKSSIASLLFILALLSKQNAVVFAPIFAIIFIKKFGLKSTIKDLLVSLIFFWLVFFPFGDKNHLFFPFVTYWNKILVNSVSDYVTYHAFNIWILFVGNERVHDSTTFLLNLSYQLSGYILFGIVLLFTLWRVYKEKVDAFLSIYSITLVSFASFLFLTRLHERHFEPTLPFLLLVTLKKKLLPIFIFVSIFHFINLYHDWWAPRVDLLTLLLSDTNIIKIMVGITLTSFVFLAITFFKPQKSV